MKKISVNILCSTAITLLILSILGAISGAQFLLINSVFQSFIVNIVIHIGLLFTHRFESSYAILEFALDIGYLEVVVIIFGAIFNWYGSTPIWVLVIMTTIIYIVGVFLNMVQMRQEVEEINELLQKRK
ncbi:hypothetical protein GCM10008910_47940 [Faecalicatena orotica]|uniref:DUF3021 family protein n=1 Tax=Faecalicatena orotica TaxID=1544 RepID=A0A2Y9BL33_9FIRM|nr:DUF3021 family protein [Faecalicatena orotica]PWJ17990.1 Protein of unknown function (DUF3021) [Faecalicatena orotica]SSA58756.1 Protein of unknown function [Faecalicatena orotica]